MLTDMNNDRIARVRLYLDDKPEIVTPCNFYQNDVNGCTIKFELYKTIGKPYILTTETVVVCINKEDGSSITDSVTAVDGSSCYYTFPSNAIDLSGKHTITLYVHSYGNQRVTFGTVKFKVTADLEPGQVASSVDYPILVQLIEEVKNLPSAENVPNDLHRSGTLIRLSKDGVPLGTGINIETIQGKPGIDGKDGKDGTNGVDGTNGIDGVTPILSGINASTLPPGSQATASITEVSPNTYSINIGIPRGDKGEPGTGGGSGSGQDGITPTFSNTVLVSTGNPGTNASASISEISNNHYQLSLTIPRGQQGIQGQQGIPGTNGRDGANGRDGVDGQRGIQGVQGIQGIPGVRIVLEKTLRVQPNTVAATSLGRTLLEGESLKIWDLEYGLQLLDSNYVIGSNKNEVAFPNINRLVDYFVQIVKEERA